MAWKSPFAAAANAAAIPIVLLGSSTDVYQHTSKLVEKYDVVNRGRIGGGA